MKLVKIDSDTIVNLDKVDLIDLSEPGVVKIGLTGESGYIRSKSKKLRDYLEKLALDLS